NQNDRVSLRDDNHPADIYSAKKEGMTSIDKDDAPRVRAGGSTGSRKFLVTFDPKSFDGLEQVRKLGLYASLAEAIRDSIRLCKTVLDLRAQGYKELVVRNPRD